MENKEINSIPATVEHIGNDAPTFMQQKFNKLFRKRSDKSHTIMIWVEELINILKKNSINFYTGVPDSVLKDLSNYLNKLNKKQHIIATNEGSAVSIGIGHYLSTKKNLILLCGHYKGVDHRVRDYLITKEISIGNYVLSGGELPAAILCDSIIRLIPGVIGDESSALSDSFQDNVVSAPIYTRPANYKGLEVPDVLISGNQKEIEKWKDQKSLERTKLLRPKLFDNL